MPDSLNNETHVPAEAAPVPQHDARADHDTALRDDTVTVATDSLAVDSLRADSLAAATPVAVKAVAPPAPPAWHSGLEPVTRPVDAARDPAVAGIFLLLFLILAVSLRHSRRLFAMLWRDLTSIRSREKGFDERTPADKRLIAVFYIQLAAFLGLLTQSGLRLIAPGTEAGTPSALTLPLVGMWGAYYVFAQCAYRVTGYTFAPSEQAASQWLRGFNASQVLAGFVLSVPAICAVFWPGSTAWALTAGAAIYVAARLAFIAKGFRIFHKNLMSLLYFFLYLCALEIVPMVILYRLALSMASDGAV